MYLTHIDEQGNDSPAILIDNATAANRAVNLPEFANIPPDGLLEIATPAVELYKKFDHAMELSEQGHYAEAIVLWNELEIAKPGDARIYNNLGEALARTGKTAEAIAEFERALELNPRLHSVHNSLGLALTAAGRPQDAIVHFEKVLESYPESADLHNNYGRALAMRERLGDAMAEFQRAAELDPRSADAQNNIGRALAAEGRIGDAIPHLQKAVAINPDFVEAQYYLGAALYYARGRSREALVHWREVLRVQPGHLPALNQAAHVLAAANDASVRNGREAVQLAERAAALPGGQEPPILDTLAAAYAEVGRFTEAVETERRAMDIATSRNQTELREELAARIRLYEKKTPFRDAAPK
jgi:tetratricopeptide (TPR) repeat protein